VASRLEESFQALKNALQVVVIDLETGDDAQVIFETLNARGEPLLPADLLRTSSSCALPEMGSRRRPSTKNIGSSSMTNSGGTRSGKAVSLAHEATSSCSTSSPADKAWTFR
jgi:hypothetical protein